MCGCRLAGLCLLVFRGSRTGGHCSGANIETETQTGQLFTHVRAVIVAVSRASAPLSINWEEEHLSLLGSCEE